MLTLRVFLLLRKYLCLLLYNQKKSFAVTCYVFDDTFSVDNTKSSVKLRKKTKEHDEGLDPFLFLLNCCPPALMTELNAVLV